MRARYLTPSRLWDQTGKEMQSHRQRVSSVFQSRESVFRRIKTGLWFLILFLLLGTKSVPSPDVATLMFSGERERLGILYKTRNCPQIPLEVIPQSLLRNHREKYFPVCLVSLLRSWVGDYKNKKHGFSVRFTHIGLSKPALPPDPQSSPQQILSLPAFSLSLFVALL